jgi:CBS domain-containing protein
MTTSKSNGGNKKKKAAYTESHHGGSRSSSKSAAGKSGSATATRSSGKAVRDVMTPRVVAVTSVTFLPEAARIMKEEDVGALPVVQEDGTLLGIVTDRDITVRAVAAGMNVEGTQIAEVYTAEDLVTVTADTKLEEAEDVMAEHQVRRLPIVDASSKLVGMITLADIARDHGIMSAGDIVKDVVKPGGEHSQINEAVQE